MSSGLLKLINLALPDGTTAEELGLNNRFKFQSIENQLRACPRLNWQAYLENYPDVKNANVDPVTHFIKSGIFEKRKLFTWNKINKSLDLTEKLCKVSLIITLYDLGPKTIKNLKSAIEQKFDDYEIILIVPDSQIHLDSLIKYNRSIISNIFVYGSSDDIHNLRRISIDHALGKFIMLTDSETEYCDNTLNICYRIVSKGFDMAILDDLKKENKIGQDSSNIEMKHLKEYIKIDVSTEDNLINKIISKTELTLYNKIYESNFIKQLYNDIVSSGDGVTSDMHEFIYSLFYAESICQITHPDVHLKNLQYSTKNAIDRINPVAMPVNLVKLIKEHAPTQYASIINAALEIYIRNLGNLISANDYLHALLAQYDRIEIAIRFPQLYFYTPEIPVGIILNYLNSPTYRDTLSSIMGREICIFLPEDQDKITVRIAARLYDALEACQFRSRMICCEQSYQGFLLPYDKSFLSARAEYDPERSSQLKMLGEMFKNLNIGLLFYLNPIDSKAVWEIMMAELLGLHVIGVLTHNFTQEIDKRGQGLRHSALIKTLCTLNKCICPDAATEIYFRARGVDAIYMPEIFEDSWTSSECKLGSYSNSYETFKNFMSSYATTSYLKSYNTKDYLYALRSLASKARNRDISLIKHPNVKQPL